MKTLTLFIGWCILFVLCWPLAFLALIFFPLVWQLAALSPGRLATLRALLFLLAHLLGGPSVRA